MLSGLLTLVELMEGGVRQQIALTVELRVILAMVRTGHSKGYCARLQSLQVNSPRQPDQEQCPEIEVKQNQEIDPELNQEIEPEQSPRTELVRNLEIESSHNPQIDFERSRETEHAAELNQETVFEQSRATGPEPCQETL
mmetsp:Transcript_11941/g.21643  ORF Transcript_11941/g.21643 Transcript_11941/m.21643 type:complete len:140 (-) Transcript_11941:1236-1655(-)